MQTDLVLTEKAAMIQWCVKRAREEYAATPSFDTDVTHQDAALMNIGRACEAAIAMATRVVARKGLGAPVSRRDSFTLLAQAGMISTDHAERLSQIIGFRNIAMHGYTKLDMSITATVIRDGLDDLMALASALLPRPN